MNKMPRRTRAESLDALWLPTPDALSSLDARVRSTVKHDDKDKPRVSTEPPRRRLPRMQSSLGNTPFSL